MSDAPRGPRLGIKGPLLFSAFFGAIAFVVVLFAASGGTQKGLRYDLAFAAFGIAFIACLVVAAMLSMSYKENAEHLGQGDGVNLRSEDRLKRPTAKPAQAAEAEGADAAPADGAAPGTSDGRATDGNEKPKDEGSAS